MLKVGSLFSGAGLCDLGLDWAGFEHAWFCEVDPFCQAVLRRHWPSVPIYNDVSTLNGNSIQRVDVLVGGFPCQDVSGAGKRAGINPKTRSGLWYEFKRVIEEMQPKYVIIENVRGLLSLGIEDVLQGLAEIGYDAEWEVLAAAALGAPHHRERVFIVAYPVRHRADRKRRILSPLQRIVGKHQQHCSLFGWLGLRFDRKTKASAATSYCEPVIYRVDDGSSAGLDSPLWEQPRYQHMIGRVDQSVAKDWVPRLKALGNGITPHQSYAIASCLLIAEGCPVPDLPQ